jgi:hypothetical protein
VAADRRGVPFGVAGALFETDDLLADVPAAPGEPSVSAKAVGIAPMAEPMPRAMASAPTRPMERYEFAGDILAPDQTSLGGLLALTVAIS